MIDAMEIKKKEWEESYNRNENFVFFPHEEVIRFVAKYVRKRIGLNAFQEVLALNRAPRLLDLGCGIGRHVIFGHEMGLESYGIDLSDKALQFAMEWAGEKGMAHPDQRFRQGDIRSLPWEDGFFDLVVSHGVLDSMPFSVARESIPEVHRILAEGGLFYCDVISGDNVAHSREFRGEEVVQGRHEQGTIQSYFNFGKLNDLFGQFFDFLEVVLVRREDVRKGGYGSRYHMVLQKKKT